MNVSDKKGAVEIIRKNSSAMYPKPTGLSYRNELHGRLKACIFDVYGTLFISGSGDIGSSKKNGAVLKDSCSEAGISVQDEDLFNFAEEELFSLIEERHQQLKEEGVDAPEIDIREIWTELFRKALRRGYIAGILRNSDIIKLSVEYETRVNPVWPMGDIVSLMSACRKSGYVIGIVSNAQFYTPLLFPALVGKSLGELGFTTNLCFWSYKHGVAKPSKYLFRLLAKTLKEKYNIDPHETVYIGNDMLNDIYTAAETGFTTCLFAGDARSLRLREDTPCCKDIRPDGIVIALGQVCRILGMDT